MRNYTRVVSFGLTSNEIAAMDCGGPMLQDSSHNKRRLKNESSVRNHKMGQRGTRCEKEMAQEQSRWSKC